MPLLYHLAAGLTYPIARLLYRGTWAGARNVPTAGGGVVASNHLSNTDAFPLALGLYPHRRLVFMAKIELFRPPLGPLLRRLGGFPVDRSRPDREALQTAVDLCRSGELVLMFPEGTRRAKGLRKRFQPTPHSGAARIALRAGVPLIPAAVKGTDGLARLARIRVAYGEPIDVADLAGRDRRSAAGLATERLMAAIAELERGL